VIIQGIALDKKNVIVFEICIGLLLIIIGFIVWWWSTHLLWILIYPPPLAKQLIDGLPFVFWSLGALLFIDGMRRKINDRTS
jgi:hypothetical protein